MSDHRELIGRSVRVKHSANTTWRGMHSTVETYRASDDTYEIRVGAMVGHFHAHDLEPYTPVTFKYRFPKAPVIQGSHSMVSILPGAIVDFSNADANVVRQSEQLVIKRSCRVIGCADINSDDNTNTINNYVVVDALKEDIVEFENVCFKAQDKLFGTVTCSRGSVIFRKCVFNHSKVAVVVHAKHEETNIVLENCIFRHHNNCAVLVEGGRVTMLDCTIQNVGIGVVVKRNGLADLRDSRFQTCAGGVVVPNFGGAFVDGCCFNNVSDFCCLASNGSTLLITNGNMTSNTGDGVIIEGGEKTNVTITDSFIHECRFGVRIGNGSVKVKIKNVSVKKASFAYYIMLDAIGSVSCTDISWESGLSNPIAARGVLGFVNLSGDKCAVSVDGKTEPRGTQRARLEDSKSQIIDNEFAFGYPVSSMGKRLLHTYEIDFITCAKCQRQAGPDESYKKCVACREARYCTKECQVAHWPAHYQRCRVTCMRSEWLSAVGYVSCSTCGKTELQSGDLHMACSRCLNAVYCSKKCQKEGWHAHKKNCKLFIAPK